MFGWIVGSYWLMLNIATANLRQIVSATENAVNKMAATQQLWQTFGKKLSMGM